MNLIICWLVFFADSTRIYGWQSIYLVSYGCCRQTKGKLIKLANLPPFYKSIDYQKKQCIADLLNWIFNEFYYNRYYRYLKQTSGDHFVQHFVLFCLVWFLALSLLNKYLNDWHILPLIMFFSCSVTYQRGWPIT